MLYYTKNYLTYILLHSGCDVRSQYYDTACQKKKAWDDHPSSAWLKTFFIGNKNINKLKPVLNCVAASDDDSLLFK